MNKELAAQAEPIYHTMEDDFAHFLTYKGWTNAEPYIKEMLMAAFDAAWSPAQPFQGRVQPWMTACFGPEISGDKAERNHRFLEESLELVQACGATASEAHQLVNYVYGRPVGEKAQEVGGVMVTLAALCLAQGLDMHASGETELARIWTKVEQIRAKQAAKPKHSPLPESPAQPATEVLQARIAELETRPRAEFLALAEKCGARVTGKPDATEPIEIVFSVQAWRKFDQSMQVPQSNAQLAAQAGQEPVVVDGVRWDLFPGWLIDHCEGEIISEEGLQFALADMLNSDSYKQATQRNRTVQPAQAGQSPVTGSEVMEILEHLDRTLLGVIQPKSGDPLQSPYCVVWGSYVRRYKDLIRRLYAAPPAPVNALLTFDNGLQIPIIPDGDGFKVNPNYLKVGFTVPDAIAIVQAAPWNDWRRTLAEKVDNYITAQSENEGDEPINEAYDNLKAHILQTPFATAPANALAIVQAALDAALEVAATSGDTECIAGIMALQNYPQSILDEMNK